MGQGIILNLKIYYRKFLLAKQNQHIKNNTSFNFNLLQSLRFLKEA